MFLAHFQCIFLAPLFGGSGPEISESYVTKYTANNAEFYSSWIPRGFFAQNNLKQYFLQL